MSDGISKEIHEYFKDGEKTTKHRAFEDCQYQVYFDHEGTLHHEQIIANDHVDAIDQIQKKYEGSEARLVFKGDIPHHLWIG